MESFGIVWVSGILISLTLLIRDMKEKELGPSTKAWWIFLVITLNIVGFVIYLLFSSEFPRRR